MIASRFPRETVEVRHSGDHVMVPPSGQHTRDLRQHGLGFLLFSILLVAIFSKPLFSLAVYAAGGELHSHILLIPLVSAYLIYIRRRALPRDYTFSVRWALIPSGSMDSGRVRATLEPERLPGAHGAIVRLLCRGWRILLPGPQMDDRGCFSVCFSNFHGPDARPRGRSFKDCFKTGLGRRCQYALQHFGNTGIARRHFLPSA